MKPPPLSKSINANGTPLQGHENPMTSPEDDIPLPSKGVLSDEESAKQLREDSCRQYVERIRKLEAQLEGVSSSLLIANRDLDAANAALIRFRKSGGKRTIL